MKLWQKDYDIDDRIEKFTVGNDHMLDLNLVRYDCIASIAHAKMLYKIGVLCKNECSQLVLALNEIIRMDSRGQFKINREDEDCHTAIEKYLVKTCGSLGKKIHTARSRNDQVLVALRLYYRDQVTSVEYQMADLTNALYSFMRKYNGTQMPGYTHMRKAMPSSINIWAESFIESMSDNVELLKVIARLADQSPLGSGAGYGLPLKVDRKHTAKLLRFRRVQNNPLYVQNSRGKFESSLMHALNHVMFDLNRMASDIILFSMPEFGYFRLPEKFCTGSSIMPHKRNPDVLELIRAKYHQTLSCEFKVKTLIGNLVSGYNRDLQLTKEPVMKCFETTIECLEVMILLIYGLEVDKKACKRGMTKELYSVKKVHELVQKKVPFRDAYRKIAKRF